MNKSNIKIALLQFNRVKKDNIDKYLGMCSAEDAQIVVFGEYVINDFYKNQSMKNIQEIKRYSDNTLSLLKDLACKYNFLIIAPIIISHKKKLYKTIAKISPKTITIYHQRLLINYSHWNEDAFFDNHFLNISKDMVFRKSGFRFAVMGGFEVHFDYCFYSLYTKNIDVLILPTSSSFNSNKRWRDIIKTRSLLNSFYIARCNKVGSVMVDNISWNFYGDSFIANPFGEIETCLGDEEGIMLSTLYKSKIKEAKDQWGFKSQIKKLIK